MDNMVDRAQPADDDGSVPRVSAFERVSAAIAVAAVVVAVVLSGRMTAPAGDAWTEGAAGARLWLLLGMVPVVVAAVATVAYARDRTGRLLMIGLAAAV